MRQRPTKDRTTALGLLLDGILIEPRTGRYSWNNDQLLIRQDPERILIMSIVINAETGIAVSHLIKLLKNDDGDIKVQVFWKDLLDYEDTFQSLQTCLKTYLDSSLAFLTIKIILGTWQRIVGALLAFGGGDCKHMYFPYAVSILTVRIYWTYIIFALAIGLVVCSQFYVRTAATCMASPSALLENRT